MTTAYRTTPVQVGGLSDVVAIATRESVDMIGMGHSAAVKRDGTVREWPIWGLGNSWSPKSLAPVQVEGLSDIVAVAEGGAHSLALKRDGTVWAWGENIFGQLGVQTLVLRPTPVQVLGPASQEIRTGFRRSAGTRPLGRVTPYDSLWPRVQGTHSAVWRPLARAL